MTSWAAPCGTRREGPDPPLRRRHPPARHISHCGKARLALGGGAAPTLETLGEQLGVSRERVRQLEDKALTRLRPAMAKSSAEASTLATLARLVDAGRDGWQDRVIGLASLLFPDAPERTSRRLVMHLATVKATKEQREAILSSPVRPRSQTNTLGTRKWGPFGPWPSDVITRAAPIGKVRRRWRAQ